VSRVAIFGLGEAGSVYADALVRAGHDVIGVDPGPAGTPPGVRRLPGLPSEEIDHVLVVTSARIARSLATSVLPLLDEETTWVDLTTASPAQKADIATATRPERHVDIAILGPVVSQGVDTPLLAAGRRAADVARLLGGAGAPVAIVDGGGMPGDAMAHKLLRSVLMKGLAAVVTEAVAAGAAAGREEWIRDQIAAQLAGDGRAVVDRFLSGSLKHAARRSEEMAGVVDYLGSLGVPADMSLGARDQLVRLAGDRVVV
jgi:3-hydroxyisobutyrate dehydrogenase-like beta-hydroxyacid dehydrogenase